MKRRDFFAEAVSDRQRWYRCRLSDPHRKTRKAPAADSRTTTSRNTDTMAVTTT